jgi:Fic family protein
VNMFLLNKLHPTVDLETTKVLRKCSQANRYLAELKGVSGTIPNQNILINTLSIQEAKDSSEVENIITTHDELFKEELFADYLSNSSAKEVKYYTLALKRGFELVSKNKLLTNNMIVEIQSELERNKTGFRKMPGTEIKNDQTGKTIYVPPQNEEDIQCLMKNLERYINDDDLSNIDPLIKMAVIHYQFESIHPFYDGNGRTGRIINILYLVQKKLLDIPVLYLSRYIIERKSDYYRLLQGVRDHSNWEEWILYMLDGVEKASIETITIIQEIRQLMMNYKHRIRENYKFYSQDLLNNLFCHPYTKIEFIQRDLDVTRKTAAKYLDELVVGGFLQKEKIGVNHFFINKPLFDLFTREST